MRVQALGHAAIKVRDLPRAEAFYNGVLGIPIATRDPKVPATFFTLHSHHDLALIGVGAEAPKPPRGATGLLHIAFKIGDSLAELRDAKATLERAGVAIDDSADYTVAKAIFVRDPDGNGIELYVDASDVWKEEPERMLEMAPLDL
jgi:catechol 2,3-dioxygenase